MRPAIKIGISILGAVAVLVLAVCVGSVAVAPGNILPILLNGMFNKPLPSHIPATEVSILWQIRTPRALLSFIVGAALAVSGTVMQSVLRNPLASSYTLGVSSGASLGAGLLIVTGFTLPVLQSLSIPLVGAICGIATVLLAVGFTAKLDAGMQTNTIILVGMVFSLFINAIITLLTTISRETMERILYWQMGSFAMRGWLPVLLLFPLALLGILALQRHSKELDIITFGEEQAELIGINMRREKWLLLCMASALTGVAISFVGVIGFIDLIAPHVVRKVFGSRHRIVLPMSALFGGAFMVIADLLARTLLPYSELPVGAVTALIGAPFFAFVFFSRRKRGGA